METRDIKSIIPYDRNPRKNNKAVNGVLDSLKIHGQVKPIVLSAKGFPFENEVVCCGHTTFRALKKFGAKEVKVIVNQFKDEKEFTDYNIRDNKSNEGATWDEDLLAKLSGEYDIDLKEMGFDFDISDIEVIDNFSESINFIIKCKNISELEELKKILKVKGGSITYENFLKIK